MALTTLILGTAAVSLIVHLIIKWIRDPLRRIPGPTYIPFISNHLSFGDGKLHVQLDHLAKEYGPVYKVNVHNQPVVVVNTSEAIYDALVHKGTDFTGRAVTPRAHAVLRHDIIASNYTDPAYPTLRKTFTKGLRAYGEGVSRLESIVQDTTLDIIENCKLRNGAEFDPYNMIFGYVCCFASTIMLDEKYSADDKMSQAIHTLNLEILRSLDPGSSNSLLDLFPILYNVPGLFSDAHSSIADIRKLHEEFVYTKIHEAKESFDVNNMRGCLDQFINCQQHDLKKYGKSLITDEGLAGLMLDIIFAGVSTTLGTLSHCFFELAHHPDIARRIQQQIDESFHKSDVIGRSDRETLPQLEAFLHEVNRHLSLGPIWRRLALKDSEIMGYNIPADTRVWMNNFSASHDAAIFHEPFKFNPDRFLDDNGVIVSPDHPNRKNSVSFSLGFRKCPGENVAKTMMFIFLANMLLHFNVEKSGDLPSDDPRTFTLETGITPPRFNIKLAARS